MSDDNTGDWFLELFKCLSLGLERWLETGRLGWCFSECLDLESGLGSKNETNRLVPQSTIIAWYLGIRPYERKKK